MPIYNGEFVKRCPKGYRKDKKTDQCVLIRKPTKFRVASGSFSSVPVAPPPTPPPKPPPPDPPPIDPVIPWTPLTPAKPITPVTPSTPSKDIVTGNDIGRILAEVGAPSLFLYSLAVALGRYEGNFNIEVVLAYARDMLIRFGESFGEGLFPDVVTQAVNTTTRFGQAYTRTQATNSGTLRARGSNRFIQSTQDTSTEMTTITRGPDGKIKKQVTTNLKPNQIDPAKKMISDSKKAQARIDAGESNPIQDKKDAAERARQAADKEKQQAFADELDQLDAYVTRSAEVKADYEEQRLIAAVKREIEMAERLDVETRFVDPNAPIDTEQAELIDNFLSNTLEIDAAPPPIQAAPGQTKFEFVKTFTKAATEIAEAATEKAQGVVEFATTAGRELGYGNRLSIAKMTGRIPRVVAESLKKAGATDEQIYKSMLEIEKEPNFDFPADSEEYEIRMKERLYKRFKYNTIKGTIEGDGQIAINLQNQEAEEQVGGVVADFTDDFGQPSAIQLTPTKVPRANIKITTKYTIANDDGIIDYLVEEGNPVIIKLSKNGREKLTLEQFQKETEGVKFDNIDIIEEGLGKGGNAESLKNLYEENEENVKNVTDAINEFQENTGRRQLTPKDIQKWADERGSFEDELVNDLLERKTAVNQTIDQATEAIQTSIKKAEDIITKTIKRTIDFATGKSTPIYNEYEATQELVAEYEALGGDVAAETTFFEELVEGDGLLAESGLDAEEAALAVDTVVGGTAGGAAGVAGWIQAAGTAMEDVAIAAGEEGAVGAYALGAAAATEVAVAVVTGALIGGVVYDVTEGVKLIQKEMNKKRMGEPLPPAWDVFAEAVGIIPTAQTTDNPSGYAAFFYGGTSADDLYFFDQLPEVLRMVINDNDSVQKILIKSFQFRYEQSELYNDEYPFVMDFLREERPFVTRQFTTDLRKSISGEDPLKFALKFIQPAVTTNHYIEHILFNQPKFQPLLSLIVDQKIKIQTLLSQRYVNQQQKYLTRQEQIANFKANKKDRTQLKEILKQIADNRYTSGVFVQRHSGDLHRINQALHYFDNHEYGHFGFKYVHKDAIVNVLESYNQQQIENAEQKMEDQSSQLTEREEAIVGQTQEQYEQEVINQQQIADPNLSARENAILGGASGAAAASGTPSGPPREA